MIQTISTILDYIDLFFGLLGIFFLIIYFCEWIYRVLTKE